MLLVRILTEEDLIRIFKGCLGPLKRPGNALNCVVDR